MQEAEIAAYYDRLTRAQQALFLARPIHELTVVTRGAYSESPQVVTSGAGSPAGNLNEVQHQAAAALIHVLENDPRSYGGADLAENLAFWARNGGAEKQLEHALGWVARFVNSANPEEAG